MNKVNQILSIIITSIILLYVIELDKKECDCALNWYHKFIMYFSKIVIILNVIFLFSNMTAINHLVNKYKLLFLLFGIYFLANIVYIISLLFYFLKLKESKCRCSDNWKQWALIIPVIIFSITFIFGFISGFKQNFKVKQ